MLWIVPVTFSAAQNALNCGNQVFISTGASVSGVFWNTIFTPSSVISSKSLEISRFGAIRPTEPAATFLPMDWSTWPNGLRCSSVAYCTWLRRDIALPANTFSAIAASMKPSGAIIMTLPLADVGLVHDTAHAGPVVHVRMRVHDAHHRALAELLVDQLERGAGGFLGGQRVEHDPAGVALDEADVGEVEAAHLVDAARHHLVEAVAHVQDGLALQRRVDALEVLAGQQPLVALHVPGDVAGVGHDLLVRRRGDEALLRLVEIALVVEGQLRP